MGLDEVHDRAGRRGFATRSDARAAGVADSTFNDHARRIGWTQQHRGVWVPTGVALTHTQRAVAAVASIGGEVLVTGATALLADGVLSQPPYQVELLLPSERHVTERTGVCLHRSVEFGAVRSRRRADLRLASCARAFADHAAHTSVRRLCIDLAAAVRLRRCTLTQVGAQIQARGRFPGRGRLREACALLGGELTHSAGERLARRLLRAEGLRFSSRPYSVEVDGRPIAEIDIAFPKMRYGVEVDGPHHLLPATASADRARDRRLERLGWLIDRFFWFEVEDRSAWFSGEVRRRVAQRST